MWYKEFLPKLHKIIQPKHYVEIGIRHGYSLSISDSANKIAIDPSYGQADMQFPTKNTQFFKMTSDDFFEKHTLSDYLAQPFDLGYIDGMHLFEYALRDFINLEKESGSNSIIIVDDVLPRDELEAARKPTGGSWTGDVWKIIPMLQEYRPDLYSAMILAQQEPTGCLIIVNPDSNSTVLQDCYDEILTRYLGPEYRLLVPDNAVLEKAVTADDALVQLKVKFQ